MNITLAFKSVITTKETYPHSYELRFKKEFQINEYKDENELLEIFMKSAHDFEELTYKGMTFAGSSTEILGITFIHDAKNYQLLDLARIGIERI